ncbi:MAG TPA: hypothetical protein VG347_07520, partial [Verrucomicrobiae bacterium]|nr:hypothetical protein [Verrucomicrobiae bacterium]
MIIQKLLSSTVVVRNLTALMLMGISSSAAAAIVTTNLVFTVQPASTVIGAPLTNVVVQIRDSRGTNISQAGTAVALVLSKGAGLTGVTTENTDASGKAVFSGLAITQVGAGEILQASTKILKAVNSSAFNITQGKTTNTLTAPATTIVYGQSLTLTSKVGEVAPANGTLSGTVTFK